MKRFLRYGLSGFFLLIAMLEPVLAEQTIYLIRHAEKMTDGTADPALTEAGRQRAQWYAGYFADKKLTAVYSTDLKRTRETAAPTLHNTGLSLDFYDPHDLAGFADRTRDLPGNILVVGHSNTTPYLAGLLSGQELPELQDGQYDRIFVITKNEEGTIRLHLDHSDPHTD
ncbi:phosphoglycerate mutase family protein [Emcibacter sp.]|uniref:SixA phosphatase family protein n=1 Tax=Emcibacter sp. TaxID=1979954 RepID=UPI002AA8070B|nr:phosphoglycerate mutase family protein [Emcibacter sp.]